MVKATSKLSSIWKFVKRPHTLLLTLTLIGVLFGILFGISIRHFTLVVNENGDTKSTLTDRQAALINLLGDLFLRSLKMIVTPLIFFTLINSLATLDTKMTGRLLITAFAYYVSTMFIATLVGITMAVIIRPGSFSPVIHDTLIVGKENVGCSGATALDAIMDILRNIISDNLVQNAISVSQTCPRFIFNGTKVISYEIYRNMSEEMKQLTREELELRKRDSMNLNGLVAISLLFGAILSTLKSSNVKPITDFTFCMEKVVIKIVRLFIWFSPLGVMSLIAAEIVKIDNLTAELLRLGMYMVTVICGLLIHGCIILPLMFFFLGHRNPLTFINGVSQALFVGFGTCSSSATMPVTLECMEKNINIDKRIVKFLIPLGMAINMNGTALYESVAAIYVAQCLGINFNFGELLLVSISALFAGMGTAGVPQGGLVTLVMVLTAVGLPPKYIILIIPVDWILGRCRTVVNVFDDSVACAVVNRLCEKHIKKTTIMQTENSSLEMVVNHC